MFKRITILLIFFALVSGITAQTYVTLHEDCNYKGKRAMLEAGTYKLYQMKISNDRLSSFQVPNGMKLTLYEHDDFKGKSKTFTGNIACLETEWDNNASSIVVENSSFQPGFNQNNYITFYNDCYSKGYSRSLKPGTYSGSALGSLKNNISSFLIFGNLKVRVYLNNDNASGFYYTFDKSENCLSSSYNDKISSLVIEYNDNNQPGNNNNPVGSMNYATIYTDCNYRGNSLNLQAGYYNGDKIGLLKYNISSVEIPSNLSVKVYLNDENFSGNYYTLTGNTSCLSNTLNNRIASLIIEENGNNQNYPPSSNSSVIIYTDANYRGQSVSILPGTYSTMTQLGFPDNALSSLSVPAGYRVVLYEFENFGGKTYTITSSKSGFSFSGWNDKASSIAIYRDR